jgi:hypothetical protein
LSGKFSQEYINTPDGKLAAEGLLNTIKQSKERIAYEAKVKREKMDKMLEMLESDPQMRARYEELTRPVPPRRRNSRNDNENNSNNEE